MTPKKDWPHAPIHRLRSDGVYMVTGATLHKQFLFSSSNKLTLLENEVLTLAKQYCWQLEAWAVFMNHYHLIARGQSDAERLDAYLNHPHFWETRLTYERSYLARLNYVHQNPVKHGLVRSANRYQWCSAAWLEPTASPATVKTIYSFKTEKLKVDDDY